MPQSTRPPSTPCIPARRAAPTIGKYTVSNPTNGTTNADGTIQLIDGKPPLDPATNLIYNDEMKNWEESIYECNKMCAHLATFASQQDQHEAEAYFISQVGLRSGLSHPEAWFAFAWVKQCTHAASAHAGPAWHNQPQGLPTCLFGKQPAQCTVHMPWPVLLTTRPENPSAPQNIIIPEYHTFYWHGLFMNDTMGWKWIDPFAPGPEGVYAKWGVSTDGQQRPFNSQFQCAGGNVSESVGDANSVVWGWAEEDCLVPHTFMCRKPPQGPSETMTTNSTNVTFYLNTTPSTYDDAQQACRRSGGNLAIYTSLEEQAEVRPGACRSRGLAAGLHRLAVLQRHSESLSLPRNRPDLGSPACCPARWRTSSSTCGATSCPAATRATGWATARPQGPGASGSSSTRPSAAPTDTGACST